MDGPLRGGEKEETKISKKKKKCQRVLTLFNFYFISCFVDHHRLGHQTENIFN